MARGQNGSIGSWLDGSIPGSEFGEDVDGGDFVGFRTDADSRVVLFKAFAGVTAGQNRQCPAVGVAGSQLSKYRTDAVRPNKWRIMLPVPLPTDMTGAVPGDKGYLSVTNPGGIQAGAPSTTGELVQVLGTFYWEGSRDTGINPGEEANAFLVDVENATVVP